MAEEVTKAYNNIEFLNSPDARTVRVLCEFIEPRARFRDNDVEDTIVFFGSARIKSQDKAEAALRAAKQALDADPHTRETQLAHTKAEKGVALARYYEQSRELARRLTAWAMTRDHGKRFLVCSGGGPGIMEAANRGASEAGGKTVGLNISLPHEQEENPYITPELCFEFHYFFVRKFWFMYLAKALVVFPGGFGTMDELFEVLTLIQTGTAQKVMPVVLFGSEYWKKVLNLEHLLEWGTISPEDLELFKFFDDVDEAYDYLTKELTRLYL